MDEIKASPDSREPERKAADNAASSPAIVEKEAPKITRVTSNESVKEESDTAVQITPAWSETPTFFNRIWPRVKRDTTSTDWLIVLLTAVIAITSWLQWHEIRNGSTDTHSLAVAANTQAEAAKRSADAASDSVRSSREIMQLDERAWINIGAASLTSQLLEGRPIEIPMQIGDTGKTPAQKVNADFAVELLKPMDAPTFIYGKGHPRSHLSNMTVLPGQQIHISPRALRNVQGAPPDDVILTLDIQKEIETGEIDIVIHGRITYFDIFGVYHWVRMCTIGAGSLRGPVRGGTKACDEYNGIDDNPELPQPLSHPN